VCAGVCGYTCVLTVAGRFEKMQEVSFFILI
jgi:hypothetical protein